MAANSAVDYSWMTSDDPDPAGLGRDVYPDAMAMVIRGGPVRRDPHALSARGAAECVGYADE
jgi:hypothetical protein